MGRASRNKGKRGEREAAKLLHGWLSDAGIIDANIQRNLAQSRSGGFDLEGLPRWLAVEVKRAENLRQGEWWRQTKAQAKHAGRLPVLMYRQSRRSWRFRVSADVLIGEGRECVTVDIDLDADLARLWLIAETLARQDIIRASQVPNCDTESNNRNRTMPETAITERSTGMRKRD